MAMRAQISLQFDDADLFDNFITPYKEGRVLNSLIIKCLSAYYYNEDVRNLIEGTSIEEATDGETVQTSQSLCDNIRASLLMQDFLASELQNTINNGTDDIENILNKTNDFAEKSGVAKPTTTEYGSNILQISANNTQQCQSDQSSSESMNLGGTDKSFSILADAVLKLAESLGNNEVIHMLHPSEDVSEKVESPVVTETISSEVKTEVLQPTDFVKEEIKEEQLSSIEIDDDFVTEEAVSFENDFDDDSAPVQFTSPTIEDTDNSNDESSSDASDAMKELLGSLF